MDSKGFEHGMSPPNEAFPVYQEDALETGKSTTHNEHENPQRNSTVTHAHESEPLISGPRVNHPGKSHRELGVQSRNDSGYNTINGNNRSGKAPLNQNRTESTDPERYAQQEIRLKIHKDYRLFLNNWKWILNLVVLVNTLFLIGVFVSEFFFELIPPASRNESFENIVLLFIALIGNSFNLWFNDIGLFSPWDFKTDVVLISVPVLNVLILLMNHYTRNRMNFLSMSVFGWLIITFALSLMQSYKLKDYIVELQGSDNHNRHTMKEWMTIGFRNTCKIIILVVLTLITLNSILFTVDTHNLNDSNHYTYIDPAHKRSIHLRCYGLEKENNTQPIVLYEHGGEDTSFKSGRWIEELYNLGHIDRYCIYDRVGYGLSDSASAPWSLKDSSDALRYALVEEMKLKGPFTVVGYDYGGLVARTFVSDNRDLCDGLMLIESWHEELLKKKYFSRLFPGDDEDDNHSGEDNHSDSQLSYRFIEKEIGKRKGFKIWWDGLWSTIGLNSHYSWLAKRRGSRERIYGRDMKHEGKFLRTKFLEIVTSSLLSYRDILQSNEKIRNTKLSVVSSKEMIKKSSLWGDWQRKLTKISTKTKEWKIVDGEHAFFENSNAKELVQDVLLRLLNE